MLKRSPQDCVSRSSRFCLRRRLAWVAVLLLTLGSLSAFALDENREFDIKAQNLSSALIEFSQQSGLVFIAPMSLLEGKESVAVQGAMLSSEALPRLLNGTGLAGEINKEGVLVIRTATRSATNEENQVNNKNLLSLDQGGRKKAPRGFFAALLAGLVSNEASAQTPTVQTATLDEVIVTAERRVTNLQDTPIAVTAISADDIYQMNVGDTRDLADFIPNLVVKPSYFYGSSVPTITMRGVGAGATPTWGIANEPAVAIYIDGMYYGRNPGSILSLAEIEGIEVLRGPQGTLFGRNTTGGAISYRTHKASPDELEGYVNVAAGEFGERNLKFGVNVPLSDKWAMRTAYADLNQDGYVYRGSDDFNDINSRSGRLAFHGEPTDRLTMDFSLFYTENDTTGASGDIESFTVNDGAQIGGQFQALSIQLENQGEAPIVENDPRLILDDYTLPAYCAVDGDADPHTIGAVCDNHREFDLTVAAFTANYDVSDAVSFKSFTGHLRGNSDVMAEGLGSGTWQRPIWQSFESFQQEFQANVNLDRWNAVAGLIYYSEDATEGESTYEARVFGDPNADFFPGDAFPTERERVLSGTPSERRNERYGQHTQSTALYGQATFSATDKLDVIAGMRYTRDQKEAWINYLSVPIFDEQTAFVLDDRSWDATDWRATLQYRITDDVMVYVTNSRAYKAGIMNDGSLELTIGTDPQILFTDPEEVTSNEIGIRSEWFARRLRLNATYFDMTWENRTGIVQLVRNGFLLYSAVNEPDITASGVELDLSFAMTDTLTLSGTYSSNDARQKDNPDYVLSGNAENKWSLRLVDRRELSRLGGYLTTALNYAWTDEIYRTNVLEDDVADQQYDINPDYAILNGRITYESDGGNWTLSLYGQNLLDKEYTLERWGTFFWGGPGTLTVQEYRARPRSLGVEFGYNF